MTQPRWPGASAPSAHDFLFARVLRWQGNAKKDPRLDMLIPQGLLTVREYDLVATVTPTSRFGHASDSVFTTVEMLVVNDQGQEIEFPFVVLNTDSGANADDPRSVEPRLLNGSRQ